jgi:hypothetical protein
MDYLHIALADKDSPEDDYFDGSTHPDGTRVSPKGQLFLSVPQSETVNRNVALNSQQSTSIVPPTLSSARDSKDAQANNVRAFADSPNGSIEMASHVKDGTSDKPLLQYVSPACGKLQADTGISNEETSNHLEGRKASPLVNSGVVLSSAKSSSTPKTYATPTGIKSI